MVRDAVDEGVAIALSAVRLAVKNAIIVGTIGEDERFDAERFAAEARDAVLALADEADAGAARLRAAAEVAGGRPGDSLGYHDYRVGDVEHLAERAAIADAVGFTLRTYLEDGEWLARLVEQCREEAWAEISANLQRRLRGARPDRDPHYPAERAERIAELRRELDAAP